MFHLIPRPIHRLLLPIAHRVRHRWRLWSKRPIEGCSVVVTNLAGQVLLVRHSYGPQVWALPGGGLSRGETPEHAARREVQEELSIKLGNLISFGTIEEEISGSTHTAHLFTAKTDQLPQPDGREIMVARFFPAHSLPEPLGDATRRRLALWRERGSSQQ